QSSARCSPISWMSLCGRTWNMHLSTDRLAALADEQPSAEEGLHLADCAVCARELAAHRSLLSVAHTERESLGVPLTRWDTLSARLRAEGLMAGAPPERGRS